jgi:ankyrin repeat protein
MMGDCDKVQALAEAGTAVDVLEFSGGSPLHAAAFRGHVSVVECLWEKARKNTRDRSGLTVLHLATMAGESVLVAHLLDSGADSEAKDRNGLTVIHLALKEGQMAVIETLICKGANINAKTARHETPLHIAIWKGYEKIVRLLLREGAESIWTLAAYGFVGKNLLCEASKLPNRAVLEVLIDKGKGLDVNSRHGIGLYPTPLHTAAEHCRVANGRLLLARGAKIDEVDVLGHTPLLIAVEGGDVRFVRLLLKQGACVDAGLDVVNAALLWVKKTQKSGKHLSRNQ